MLPRVNEHDDLPVADDGPVMTIGLVPLALSVLVYGLMLTFGLWVTTWAVEDLETKTVLLFIQVLVIFWVGRSSSTLRLGVSESGLRALSRVQKESLHMKAVRSWDDLHSVRLRKLVSADFLLDRLDSERNNRLAAESGWRQFLRFLGQGWLKQGFLLLDFRSGGTMYFPLAGFKPKDLEDFFIAISTWADPKALNPEVVSLQRDVLTGQPLHLTESFTRMWEDDLRAHFQATNFVPLAGGTILQNGKFKILMQLACGGMSSIYLATCADGSRRVLKELVTPSASNETQAKVYELFSREARLLSKLDHPQIVKLYDHFVENGRHYIVLEYIAGLNLRQHVKMHGPFTEPEVLSIAEQAAEILNYLHSFSPPVIHRDFTPDNLVTREPDRAIVLIDFGAANEFIGSMTGTLIGKQSYIPAEQFRGEAVVASDLFSLGASMFYLLTGKDPEPLSTSRVRAANAAVSVELDSVISKLTAELPEERFQSAEALQKHLKSLRGTLQNV